MSKALIHNGRAVTCCYCKRQLQDRDPDATDGMTWDHVKPESQGGFKKVPCCRKCNQLKDDIPTEDWFWFIGTHQRWWKEFTNSSQVKRVIREFRFAQAQARGRDYQPGDVRLKRSVPQIGRHNLR
jgi:hypothetical protein